MKKSTRIAKKLLALFLVVLMSINTLGAVVSDNDGSAFITKAEFDSLKNDFQSQIDQYNTSIDAKIDGAIASYLAGLKLSKYVEERVIGYDEEGILSPRANSEDLRWKEGLMKYDWENWDTRFGTDAAVNYVTYANVNVVGKTPTEFTELSLRDVDRSNGHARWCGSCQTLQYTRGKNALNQKDSIYAYQVKFKSNEWELVPNGHSFNTMKNNGDYISLATGTFVDESRAYFSTFGTRLKSGAGTTFSKYMSYSSENFSRTINSTTNKTIIITPTSVTEYRFSDFDTWLDIYNDEFYDEKYTDSSGEHYYHTQMVSPYDFVGSISSYAYQTESNSSTKFNPMVSGWIVTSPVHTTTDRQRSQQWPYFGFVRAIRDYNKLWLDKYDDYIEEMEKTDANLNVITIGTKKHLRVSAGLPICAVKAGAWVELPITFEDTTKDYDLYVKVGSFGTSTAPKDDTTCINYSNVFYGSYQSHTSSEQGSTSNSIKIKNGSQSIAFECQKEGYIFLKWSISGNSGAGGGRLFIPKTVNTIVE